MSGFNFEKNLEHQGQAVKSVLGVFDNVEIIKPKGVNKEFINPHFDRNAGNYAGNIFTLQKENGIYDTLTQNSKLKTKNSNIIDIMMETGTGKTYTYTKTIFELNKQHGIFKFIVVVPTLPIKAGTIDFLKSESAREHFKEQYGKTIKLHIVESKKGGKNKKSHMPPAVSSFVNAGSFEKNKIQVLIINAGMINSKTMQQKFDVNLFDKYTIPFDAIATTKSFMIIDEPHKFAKENTTWQNIQKMNPQFIIRYGATFKEYENLVYTLTAVDSFNRNLVKGVIGHITEFEEGENTLVKFVNSDGKEASLKLIYRDENKTKNRTFKLSKKDSLEKIHSAIDGLFIENLNKSTLVLSNGLELKKGDKINPFSYAETLQEQMIKKAIKNHFKLEKQYLTKEVKIKPLTLFFIDNIDEYRNKDGYIRKTVEKDITAEVKNLLKTETDEFYKAYLEKTLTDISLTHGGYFSKDNSDKDEAIEKEVNEILHDKQAILNLDNPRRFIFSKWTLREGWDNPNIFQICKLRSSGSEISKLQEVGRGLRLPVNQYGNRVKDEQFYLNYFVDFTENDFVEKLRDEINQKSGVISIEDNREKLDNELIEKICKEYNIKKLKLQIDLLKKEKIDDDLNFINNGYLYIKQEYSRIFNRNDKIKKSTDKKKQIKIRTENYPLLKELWEKLNEKVVLEYKIENENKFEEIFNDFLKNNTSFGIKGVQEKTKQIDIENNQAVVREEVAIYGNEITSLVTMSYDDFLKQLSKALHINLKTIHKCFIDTKIDINKYLNQSTIRLFKQKFNNYLMYNAINKLGIEYQKVTNSIHPTKITNTDGTIKKDIDASDIGRFFSKDRVADDYFFDELFYDSELEKENIKTNLTGVVVFTKIPERSIKIPVAGGKSYSPDFAYVLNYEDGKKKLYFIVETKDTDEENLRNEKKQKIKYAEKFFGDAIQIKFKTQFKDKNIISLIQEIYA